MSPSSQLLSEADVEALSGVGKSLLIIANDCFSLLQLLISCGGINEEQSRNFLITLITLVILHK